jgi:hypothetical protein
VVEPFQTGSYKGNLILWNGIAAHLLPAMYALLGAGLYDLRLYAEMVRQKRHLRSPARYARYLIALIAGAVIGLFGSLLPQTPSVSPLAIAFLVGYAVEAFFSYLDRFMAGIERDGESRTPPTPAPVVVVPPTRAKAANE